MTKLTPAQRVQFARASLEQLRGHLHEMSFTVPPGGERNLEDHVLMFHLDAIENVIASWEAWQDPHLAERRRIAAHTRSIKERKR